MGNKLRYTLTRAARAVRAPVEPGAAPAPPERIPLSSFDSFIFVRGLSVRGAAAVPAGVDPRAAPTDAKTRLASAFPPSTCRLAPQRPRARSSTPPRRTSRRSRRRWRTRSRRVGWGWGKGTAKGCKAKKKHKLDPALNCAPLSSRRSRSPSWPAASRPRLPARPARRRRLCQASSMWCAPTRAHCSTSTPAPALLATSTRTRTGACREREREVVGTPAPPSFRVPLPMSPNVSLRPSVRHPSHPLALRAGRARACTPSLGAMRGRDLLRHREYCRRRASRSTNNNEPPPFVPTMRPERCFTHAGPVLLARITRLSDGWILGVTLSHALVRRVSVSPHMWRCVW